MAENFDPENGSFSRSILEGRGGVGGGARERIGKWRGRWRPALAVDKLYLHYEHPSAWHIAHGAVDAARRLRRSGVRVVLASNWDSRLPTLLRTLALDDEFDAIVFSADIGHEKPSEEFFHAVARAADVPAARCAHVGDAPVADVAAARSAGFGVAVLWSPHPTDDDQPIAHDFNQLADAVLSANRTLDARLSRFRVPPPP